MSDGAPPRQWLQARLEARSEECPLLEEALFAAGAQAVTLEDAGDEPILDETQSWSRSRLSALFDPAEIVPENVTEALHAAMPDYAGTIRFQPVQEQDWVALTQAQFPPMAFGSRLWVMPTWASPPPQAPLLLRLDPGQAFGTGAHPTTALCLQWLDAGVRPGESVLDYGCGSGILAIAALLLGAARAYGVDNDPLALDTARENARLNGVAERLWLGLPEDFERVHGDLRAERVVANILAGPLQDLAPTLARHCLPGGALALSGILAPQAADVAAAYAPHFAMAAPVPAAEWVRLDGRRLAR